MRGKEVFSSFEASQTKACRLLNLVKKVKRTYYIHSWLIQATSSNVKNHKMTLFNNIFIGFVFLTISVNRLIKVIK